MTPLTFSACANSSPPAKESSVVKQAPRSFQKAAERHSKFQEEVTFKEAQYVRLRGVELWRAVVGKGVRLLCCTFSESFRANGIYGQFGDQTWESWGRYFILNDLIVIREEQGGFKRYAFYRSVDGDYLKAWEGSQGKIVLEEVVVS